MFKNYSLINGLYENGIIEKLPKFLIRKIRKSFNIHFIPTSKKFLSEQNYPMVHSYVAQNELFNHFKLKKKTNILQYMSVFNSPTIFNF